MTTTPTLTGKRKIVCRFCHREVGMSGIQYGYPAPHKLTAETAPRDSMLKPGDWCPGAMRDR